MYLREGIVVVGALTLLVTCASGQITGGSGGSPPPFTCTVANGLGQTIRAEGKTELVGDTLIDCTSGSAPVNGTPIPQVDITLSLNAPVTSRILGTAGVTNATDALLLIDEPNSGLLGYGPSVPFLFCPTPATGCQEYVGTVGANFGVPVNSLGGSTPGYNVFQGLLNPDGRSITFKGVPLLPVGNPLAARIFRITNVRVDATALPQSGANPAAVTATVSMPGMVLAQNPVTAAFVVPALTPSLRNPTNTGSLNGAQVNLCSGASSIPMPIGILRYTSYFGTAFKTRVVAGTAGNHGTDGTTALQNNPATANNDVSESGLVLNGSPLSNIPGSPSGSQYSLTGNGTTAGLADFGTRFRAVFKNIPSGVTIYVSTTNLNPNSATAMAPPPGTSTLTSFAQLISSESAPETGGASAPVLAATGGNGAINWVALTPVSGSSTVTAVWEVVNNNPTVQKDFDFAVYASYAPGVACVGPTPASNIAVDLSFAPQGNSSIPRFVDPGTGDDLNLASAINVPSITQVTPAAITARTAAVPVTLTGTNFFPGYVLINGIPTAATVAGSTSLSTSAVFSTPNTTATLEIVNSGGVLSNIVSVNILPAPTVTSIAPNVFPGGTLTVTGTNFTNTMTVLFNGTGLPTTFVNVGQLKATVPSSLLNVSTALISVRTADAYITPTIRIDVSASSSAPHITTPGSLPSGSVSVTYRYEFAASGGKGALSWGLNTGSVPPGMEVHTDGTLRGVPTTMGTYTFSVVVSDTAGQQNTAGFSITIQPAPLAVVAPAMPSVTAGSPIHVTFTASGGVPPDTFTATGHLPTGTTLSPGGVLSGTATTAGTYAFTISVSDSAKTQPAARNFTIVVNPAALTISPTVLSDIIAGTAYHAPLAASGGVPPYKWSGTGLPVGLRVAINGAIEGTTLVPGPGNVSVTVKDNAGNTDTRILPFTVVLPPAPVH